jgi:hypothetical protein
MSKEPEDPALSQDCLPQPYRMVWKVLDEYILDPAWLEITRLHPELLQDETGDSFATPHNQALANICTPSNVTEQGFGSTSLLSAEGLIFTTTDTNDFIVIEPSDGKIVKSLVLEEKEPEKTEEEKAAAEAAALEAAKGKKGKGPAVEAPPPKPKNVTNMWIGGVSSSMTAERVLTFSICNVVSVPEEQEQESDDPKKKGKMEMVLVQAPKVRIMVVQAVLGAKDGFKASLIQLKVVGQLMTTIEAPSVGAVGKVDISPDGRLLCVGTSLTTKLFSLPVPIETMRTAVGKAEIVNEMSEENEGQCDDEDKKGDESVVLPDLPLLLELKAADFFEGKKVKHTTLFPLAPRKAPMKPASGSTAAATVDESIYYDTAIAVVFEDAQEWQVLGLRGLNGEGKPNDADVTEEKPNGSVTASVLFKWRLSAPASAVAFDEDRSTIVLGLRDGTLCLWNLAARALASVLGRHETAVAAVSFSHGTGSSSAGRVNHHILSGAEDGSMCLFSVLLPEVKGFVTSSVMPTMALSADSGNDAACITTSFQSFRLDVNAGISIVGIRSIGEYSWAAVQCSDGMCILYDVQSGQLMGRLALYSGMTSRQVKWRISNFKDCITPTPPTAEDDLGYPIETTSEPATKNKSREETYPDPNAFSRLPPAKRAGKYAVSNTFEWATPIENNCVATASALGFHCMYHRNDLPVLALFKVEDVLTNFYPHLTALLQSKSAYNIDVKDFFKKLTPDERTNPLAAARRVSEMYDVFGDGGHGAGTSKTLRSRAGSRVGTSGGMGGRPGDSQSVTSADNGSIGSASQNRRNTGNSRSNSTQFTKKNIDALQVKLGVSDVSSQKAEKDTHIIDISHERLMEPTTAATRSSVQSSQDRAIRKQRLMNRLGSISNIF